MDKICEQIFIKYMALKQSHSLWSHLFWGSCNITKSQLSIIAHKIIVLEQNHVRFFYL